MATADPTVVARPADSGSDLSTGVVFAAVASLAVAAHVVAWHRNRAAADDDRGSPGGDVLCARISCACDRVAALARELQRDPAGSTRASRNRLLRALADLQRAVGSAIGEVTS